jgi:hypothetical protein
MDEELYDEFGNYIGPDLGDGMGAGANTDDANEVY